MNSPERHANDLLHVQNKMTKRAVFNGLILENCLNYVCSFEMHRPNVRKCRLLKTGKIHAESWEAEQLPTYRPNHCFAKGVSAHYEGWFEKAKQRRIAAGTWDGVWPGELYRYRVHAEPYTLDDGTKNRVFHIELRHGDLLKWRASPFSGVGEQFYSDEKFLLSCAGPLDVLLDGVVDDNDLDAFLADPYDWNLDGEEPGQKDIDDFMTMWETGEIPPSLSGDMYQSGNFTPGSGFKAPRGSQVKRKAPWSASYPSPASVRKEKVVANANKSAKPSGTSGKRI